MEVHSWALMLNSLIFGTIVKVNLREVPKKRLKATRNRGEHRLEKENKQTPTPQGLLKHKQFHFKGGSRNTIYLKDLQRGLFESKRVQTWPMP